MTADDHGSYSTYSNHKCRCADCRAANVDYQRGARARRAEALREGRISRPHGVLTTYTNYGCRCADCIAANTAYGRARSARAS